MRLHTKRLATAILSLFVVLLPLDSVWGLGEASLDTDSRKRVEGSEALESTCSNGSKDKGEQHIDCGTYCKRPCDVPVLFYTDVSFFHSEKKAKLQAAIKEFMTRLPHAMSTFAETLVLVEQEELSPNRNVSGSQGEPLAPSRLFRLRYMLKPLDPFTIQVYSVRVFHERFENEEPQWTSFFSNQYWQVVDVSKSLSHHGVSCPGRTYAVSRKKCPALQNSLPYLQAIGVALLLLICMGGGLRFAMWYCSKPPSPRMNGDYVVVSPIYDDDGDDVLSYADLSEPDDRMGEFVGNGFKRLPMIPLSPMSGSREELNPDSRGLSPQADEVSLPRDSSPFL